MPFNKSDLRKHILERRSALAVGAVEEKSHRILQGLSLLHGFRQSGLVMCYMDFRNEVMTSGIISSCLSRGIRVAVPRCVKTPLGECDLEVFEIKDISSDVQAGTYGIREPVREKTVRVAPQEIDTVLVPGVAFDGYKYRIGYGAGYYDRFLESVKSSCFKIGLAFDLQLVDKVPAEEHDKRMDVVVTESRIIF